MKLVEYEEEIIWRGHRIRYLADAYEGSITRELMVYLPIATADIGLICISGYSAGDLHFILPEESLVKGTRGLSRDWLIENFNKYIDEECDIGEVHVMEKIEDPHD